MRLIKNEERGVELEGAGLVGTDSEWSTVVNALRTAAEVYENDAAALGEAVSRSTLTSLIKRGLLEQSKTWGRVIESGSRFAQQMMRQAAEARALADKIAEEAGV